MPELHISSDFTVEDIHRVREYNYEMTKNMTAENRRNYYKKGANIAQKRIDALRKEREGAQNN